MFPHKREISLKKKHTSEKNATSSKKNATSSSFFATGTIFLGRVFFVERYLSVVVEHDVPSIDD